MRRLVVALAVIVAAIIGGTAIYFLMAIPRDLRADELLRQAHDEVKANHQEKARERLREIVRSYPRTDAGAAASAALFEINDVERARLQIMVDKLKSSNESLTQRVGALESRLRESALATTETVVAPQSGPASPIIRKAPAKRRGTGSVRRSRRRSRRHR